MANILKTFALVLIVSILFFACGCQEKKKKTQETALNKISSADTEISKTALRKRINRKYTDADAHYELGKIYQADGLWEKAETEYHIATSFDPAHWRAEAAKVKMLIQKGDKPRAELTAEQAMNRAGVSAESSLLLGKAFQREFLDEKAVTCYHQALTLAPNSSALHRQIGYYYLSKNQNVRAEEYLRRSFQLNPYQPEVAGELGRMGVVVQIPRKRQKNTKKLDKMLNSKD